tara:strand:+ start:144 stop:548 length:405 start_codon:yes stop_codon:yes gene_type:complete
MDFGDLTRTLLEKAIELANRYDFDKCEQITRILLSLPATESKEEENNDKPTESTEIDEIEALENLELVDETYRGQLWLTVKEVGYAFAQPEHEIRKWIADGEVETQPRPGDKRGTILLNSISVSTRIDRGYCPR